MSKIPVEPPIRQNRSAWHRWAVWLPGMAVLLYFGGALVLYLAQDLLIFSGAYVHGRKAASAESVEALVMHTIEGKRIAGIFGRALNVDGTVRSDAATRPTILFFYGNGDGIQTSMRQFRDFRRLGANVLIPEYVGYPSSDGKPSEAGFYATADAAYSDLLMRQDVDPRQIVLVGRSIGAATAIDLAARKPVAGLVTFSAFTSMDDMARKIAPIYPTFLLLNYHFDNSSKIMNVKCPIFMAHGTADDFVPFAMMAHLALQAKAPVIIVPILGADHNNVFDVHADEVLGKLGVFLNSVHLSAVHVRETGHVARH